MNIPSGNEALTAFADGALRRELAIRQATRMQGHMTANKEAARGAVDALLLASYHRPGGHCDDDHLTPLSRIVTQNRAGFDMIACPACYLLHLADSFDEAWQPEFMAQVRLTDYHQDSETRGEHIDDMLDNLDVLLPLTFHPGSQRCSDDEPLQDRRLFLRGERGTEVACPRCFLLNAQADSNWWPERFQLRPHFHKPNPIWIPRETDEARD